MASEAELILGEWAAQDLRFEQAEGYFERVIRRAPSPALQAEATARLAAIYLLKDELHLPVCAMRLLDTLEHDFAEVQMPANVLAAEATEAASHSSGRR